MEEHEEVSTTRRTELALEQDLSTFAVPLMAGLINFSCKQFEMMNITKQSKERPNINTSYIAVLYLHRALRHLMHTKIILE